MREAVAATPVILGILPSISVTSCFLTGPLVSMALPFLTNSSYTIFLTTLFFTISLCLLKITGVIFDSSTSNLSISDFNLAKSALKAKFDDQHLLRFKSHFVA